jgi:hypothetical protein
MKLALVIERNPPADVGSLSHTIAGEPSLCRDQAFDRKIRDHHGFNEFGRIVFASRSVRPLRPKLPGRGSLIVRTGLIF